MRRTKLSDRELPDYTRGEEISNMISHTVGGAFGIAALVMCVVYSVMYRNIWGLAGGLVYGISMILLYTVSSVYHGLNLNLAKKVFQVIDHCTIYILIAGTYVPILLTGVRAAKPVLAWILFAVIMTVTTVGIVLTSIDLRKFRVFSMSCYLAIGWSVVFALKPLLECYPRAFFMWIILGGVVYTSGLIFYALGSRGRRYTHFAFHLFVLLGSVLQFMGIIKYCIMVE